MNYNFLINISKYLLIFFPILLITGPFLTDLSGTMIGIFVMLFIILSKKKKYIFNKYFYFFLVTFLILNLSSFFSLFPSISFIGSLTYLRLILFIFAVAFLINNFADLPKKIFQIYFICILFLLIDSLLILIFDQNIFNNVVDGSSPRIRSFFDDEEIMGSFVSRTLPVIIGISYFINNKNIIKYNFILIIIAIFLIIISGERTALGNFFIFFLFYLFLERKFFLPFLFGIFVIIIIIFQINNESLKRHFVHTFNQANISSNQIIFFSLRHTMHYHTAFDIFKDHPFLGGGIKSFRYICSDDKYVANLKNKFGKALEEAGLVDGCNTHPHHIYLQFLSEVGFIGFLPFFIIFIYVFLKLFKLTKKTFFGFLTNKNKANYFFLVSILISMFPLLPSGNYFNNWYIFINYFPIGFYLATKINKNDY